MIRIWDLSLASVVFLFPAHAGMIRRQQADDARARYLFPAHAGMIRKPTTTTANRITVPRTRGDDPDRITGRNGTEFLFPAHAGMIPAKVLSF